MGERDFEEGRYFELKGLITEFEALFGEEPSSNEARAFHAVLMGELDAVLVNLQLEEQEGE